MFNSLVSLRQLNQPELASFISGFLTGLTTGTQTTNNYINSGAITTGQTGIFVTIPYLTSTLASQSLQASFTYYPLSNPSGFTSTSEFTGVISFLGLNGITISGSGQSIIVSQSSFLTGFNSGLYTLNSQTGIFVTTGQTGSFGGGSTPTGNLTGVFYPLIGNPSGYLTAINTGNFITTNQTGVFATTGNIKSLSGYLNSYYFTSAYINNNYASITQLNSTGFFIQNEINSLNIWSGNSTGLYYPLISNPNGYLTGFNSGLFYLNLNPSGFITNSSLVPYTLNANTGNFITVNQTGQFVTINNLNSSGITLQNEINSLIIWTGTSTGLYYPLNSNPNNYITGFNSGIYVLNSKTGSFITTGQTGAFGGGITPTGNLTGVFYPLNNNPSGYINTNQLSGYLPITSGVFITGAYSFNNFIYFQNGIEVNGGNSTFSDIVFFTNQIFSTAILPLSSSSSLSDISGNISVLYPARTLYDFGNNVTLDWQNKILYGNWTAQNLNLNGNSLVINSGFSNLNCLPTTIWNVISGVVEDKRILNLTGSTTLAISGLYNGWEGLLKTIQSGSGFNLNLPSGTKVAYNGSGQISLTTGISGSIDFLSFVYDGNTLFANIANQFS